MGPLLAAFSPDASALEKYWTPARAALVRLSRQNPVIDTGGTGWKVAVCAQLYRPGQAGWHRSRHDTPWFAMSGAMFCDGDFGPNGLEALARRVQGGLSWEQAASSCEGAFAVVSGDPASGEAIVVTDRLGTVHLYHAFSGGVLLICTSSLVLASLLDPAWNPVACREFFATGTVFETNSLFQGIEKFPPATVTRFRNGTFLQQWKHWDVTRVLWDGADSEGDTAGLAAALSGAMDTIGRNFPHPVLDLTGGFDSRAILGAMRGTGRPFSTVVNGQRGDPDVDMANFIAAKLRLDHRQQESRRTALADVWDDVEHSVALLDGEYDALLYCNVLDVHRRLSQQFDISINGSCGEICKGYWWEVAFPFIGWRGKLTSRKLAAARFAYAGEPAAEFLALDFNEDIVDHFAAILDRANASLANFPNTALIDHAYLSLRMQRWQGRIASATLRLWPAASPFAFRDVMQMALSARPSLRLRHRMSRRLIETLDPELSRIPLDSGYPAAPLRWNNWPAFVSPFLSDVKRKLRRRLRGDSAVPVLKQSLEELWSLPQVQDMMSEPRKMRSGELYREQPLAEFLSASRRPDFGGKALFGRVMTLEMTARLLRA